MKTNAQIVVLHANKKSKRGKNPSLPYKGERNPQKALSLALADLEKKERSSLRQKRSFVNDPINSIWGIGTGNYCPDCGGLCGNSNHNRRW